MSYRILEGDCLDVLATLDSESVQTCITSPPYWGLRDYGVEGQLGLEPTPKEYVANLVAVFREVRRVLREDGTLWLNLGDSYAGSWGAQSRSDIGISVGGRASQEPDQESGTPRLRYPGADSSSLSATQIAAHPKGQTRTGSIPPGSGLKPKDLVGIPWAVAFALRADGWYLRSDVIWAKPNPMPESVTDRPTKAHEYLFLLSKSPRYFYDADAIREEHLHPRLAERANESAERVLDYAIASGRNDGGRQSKAAGFPSDPSAGRNKRSVWTVTTQPFPGAHFATFPPKLIEPCILAGSAEGDTVLDPFAGAGTTGVVALRHNRDFLGIELNPEYAQMARDRIHDDAPLLNVEVA